MPYWNNRSKITNDSEKIRVAKRKPMTVYFDGNYYIFDQGSQRASEYFSNLEYSGELEWAVSHGYATKVSEDTLIEGHMSMKRVLTKVDALVNKGSDIDPEVASSLRREITGLWEWIRDPRTMIPSPSIPEK
tara:strand:+ start:457 stop:852 length:396 start_codon:yes stop_codon:yes gene_type:complete